MAEAGFRVPVGSDGWVLAPSAARHEGYTWLKVPLCALEGEQQSDAEDSSEKCEAVGAVVRFCDSSADVKCLGENRARIRVSRSERSHRDYEYVFEESGRMLLVS